MLRPLALSILLAASAACSAPSEPDREASNAAISAAHPQWLGGATKLRAEALTSLFENGTTTIQWGYVENIDDGRGYTAGRAGFTTANGDALQVVELYTKNVPRNDLAKFIPRLRELAKAESGDVTGLDGYVTAWRNAAGNSKFREAQDAVKDELYFTPAMNRADDLGLETALARAELYDAIVQHGEGDDPDGLPALLAATNAKIGGSPKSGIDEKKWLDAFFTVRRADLAHASDPDSRAAWAESVSRVDALRAIAAQSNWELHGPITVHSGDVDGHVP